MIDDKFNGHTMASGIKYDASTLVASSNVFPIGTVLLVSNPLVQGTPLEVVIMDFAPAAQLALSSGAFSSLQIDYSGKGSVDVQVVDYLKKRPRLLNDN
tara:strand:- start:7297 stop:7593 length:297 start_codon:yes stop_codon:yes gene_type:complete